uniref:Chorion peroxidase n=1 Tax=Magallana gigas TaxID=29159 RepID=A0A8W8NS78_MAGGI|nr:peroxidase-like protein isoform X2 [Crassostrea gigas]
MYKRLVVYVLLCAAYLRGKQGQSIDSVVKNAIDSAFSEERVQSRASSFSPRESAFRNMRGSNAVNALNRFSQSEDPVMNAKLEDRAKRAAVATMRIVMNPAVINDLQGGERDRTCTVTTDPRYTTSFQRNIGEFCEVQKPPVCDHRYPYRAVDGSCNNLYNPLLGKSLTPQSRILRNAYDNCINKSRTLTTNRRWLLPSARVVSNAVLSGPTPNSVRHSTFLTHFGQFIDHDIISTPSMKENGDDINDCCTKVPKFACFTIDVPFYDPHFQGLTCMNMVRHFGALPLDCKSGVREQVNQRSSFIDGSAIYGSNLMQEGGLRSKVGGRLLESEAGLPPHHPCLDNIRTHTEKKCFNAGDHRINEIPGLSVLHITWLRRHNLITDALRTATGITDDETLFQEAKRIVVAELQHITYNEFLPEILNNRFLTFFNLRSRPYGHDNIYDPSVDPRTFNSFGAAVFRMGHSLVRNVIGHDNGRGQIKTYPIREHFDNPDLMYHTPCEPGDFPPCGTTPLHGFEYTARWMSKAPKSRSDSTLVNGIRNNLFEGRGSMIKGETKSFDLGALNIQRGREHGLPPYNAFRKFCGLCPAYHFIAGVHGGLENHSPQNAANLARVYRSPHDIDLYAGGISETPVRGGILGPTFSCLLAYQFSLYKHGDRFWYENKDHENPRAAFTEDQLAQIKQITHAKVLCSVLKDDHGDIRYQARLFKRQHKHSNRRIPCARILNGNYLGFDITPFANELRLLGGNRRGQPWNPFERFNGRVSSLHGRSIPSGPRFRIRKAPVDVGFRVPLPRNVF